MLAPNNKITALDKALESVTSSVTRDTGIPELSGVIKKYFTSSAVMVKTTSARLTYWEEKVQALEGQAKVNFEYYTRNTTRPATVSLAVLDALAEMDNYRCRLPGSVLDTSPSNALYTQALFSLIVPTDYKVILLRQRVDRFGMEPAVVSEFRLGEHNFGTVPGTEVSERLFTFLCANPAPEPEAGIEDLPESEVEESPIDDEKPFDGIIRG